MEAAERFVRRVAASLWPSRRTSATIVGPEAGFMPTANPAQQGFLEPLRDEVLEVMQGLFALDKEDMALLSEVKLGVLRSNATQRHGATRWQRLPDGSLNLELVDLHPALLVKAWRDYALFVLYHEFIHVLGHVPTMQRFGT